MLLRAEEAARMLGLGRSKVFQMLAAGELPVVRIGRSVRIPREELREWIKQKAAADRREHLENWRAIFAARKEGVHRRRTDLGFEDYSIRGGPHD
ncbi:MAG TPA: helix-turn-helix domain-containing protein [Candidatus Dormibacteraeota bacterium]